MKVIDLLNKIANGEEVPEEIKVGEYTFHFDSSDDNEFYCYKTMSNDLITDIVYLNDEVEIISSQKEIKKMSKEEIRQSIIKMYEPLKDKDIDYYIEFQKIIDYISELEETIDNAIEYIENKFKFVDLYMLADKDCELGRIEVLKVFELLDILKGGNNE